MKNKEERAYVSPRARCPLYLHQSNKRVFCDGENIECRIILVFANQEERNRYLKEYCERNYEHCKLYGMILSDHLKEDRG